MGAVHLKPMPESIRRLPKRLRPRPAPIFPGCPLEGPSEEDKARARVVWDLLDDETKDWYGRNRSFLEE
jgi:hypothetical protein